MMGREVRGRLRFDVDRLRDAAWRLERVDEALGQLRRHLEARARALSYDATAEGRPELANGGVHLLYAQAAATAQLARKAALGEILSTTSLSLIAAMAVSRWLWALRSAGHEPRGPTVVRAQIEGGRVAYRTLAALRRKKGLVAGMGQLASAVVVAELVHRDDHRHVEVELAHAIARGEKAAAALDEDLMASASLAIRDAAELLERMAARAEPAIQRLLEEADEVEARVAAALDRS